APYSPPCARTHPTLPSFPTRRSSDLAVIRHLLDRHDLLTEQIDCGLVETFIDMGQHQLAALIDNDAGGIVPKGIMLHEPEGVTRSEEHTSELQSRFDLVCRLLLEKKK